MSEAQDFWRDLVSPDGYINAPPARSEGLVTLFEELHIERGSHILELGCNAGRNLNYLAEAGYRKLYGIEISRRAVEAYHRTYPECGADVIEGTIEHFVSTARPGSFEVVFSMACLMHLPYESDNCFRHIATLPNQYLITVECEESILFRNGFQLHFPRNYGATFGHLGMRMLKSQRGFPGLRDYTLRVFQPNDVPSQ